MHAALIVLRGRSSSCVRGGAGAAGRTDERRRVGGERGRNPPAETLIRAGRGTDLFVVGSRGRGGFVGLLLGSVSEQCAQHPPAPSLSCCRRKRTRTRTVASSRRTRRRRRRRRSQSVRHGRRRARITNYELLGQIRWRHVAEKQLFRRAQILCAGFCSRPRARGQFRRRAHARANRRARPRASQAKGIRRHRGPKPMLHSSTWCGLARCSRRKLSSWGRCSVRWILIMSSRTITPAFLATG